MILKVRQGLSNPRIISLKLKPGAQIFFMGIGGTAMASLAVYLKERGFSVSGSDHGVYPPMSLVLKERGILVYPFAEAPVKRVAPSCAERGEKSNEDRGTSVVLETSGYTETDSKGPRASKFDISEQAEEMGSKRGQASKTGVSEQSEEMGLKGERASRVGVSGQTEGMDPKDDVSQASKEGILKQSEEMGEGVSRDLTVVGNVMRSDYPEVRILERAPYISFPEYMEQGILKGKKNIVIAGTHGKSTVTALTAVVGGEALGDRPGFFVGAVPENFDVSLRVTSSPWFVIEGDEYDSAFFAKRPKFFYYNPFALILTGVEFDHGDIYKDRREVMDVFSRLAQNVPEDGLLVSSAENEGAVNAVKGAKARKVTFGMDKGDYQVRPVRFMENKSEFEIQHGGKIYPCVLNVPGRHNVLNATAVFALFHQLGRPVPDILSGLSRFKGVRRRFQKIGEYSGVTLFEDFAHHPTAVRTVLESLREVYPGRRLIALFEPRSWTSRLSVFQRDYATALERADVIWAAPPFDMSRIPPDQRFSSERLVQDLSDRGREALYERDLSVLPEKLLQFLKSGDVLVMMSNGGFGGVLNKLKKQFSPKVSSRKSL